MRGNETCSTLCPRRSIPAELRDRLAALGEAMGARAFATLPASVVIRAVLDRGLDALEAELGKAKR